MCERGRLTGRTVASGLREELLQLVHLLGVVDHEPIQPVDRPACGVARPVQVGVGVQVVARADRTVLSQAIFLNSQDGRGGLVY